MKIFLLVLFVVLAACRSPAAPKQTIIEEPAIPPLPPASGTPIGILLDEDTRLILRADQREKLQEIDRRLASQNEQLAGQSRGTDRPPPSAGGPRSGRRGGGGMGGPGMGGRGGASGRGGSPDHKPQPASPSIGKVNNDIATNTNAAIDEALALLDAAQRSIAETILRERGVTHTSQEPREPGTTEPSESAPEP
jgi:hypothetical protein